ncbi:glycerol ethanol, ferric requiring protein [Serendipita sp. 396]|nr:glycerol ethanol, ferric requiring protein [Serendipita sp. 396]KAG8789135.1 glycerol ethanol, ferric requiring protein [Serendipita sp. 397]KAG8804172.1 glycerol ethanol, ferric requiring protein [Serendipita sp. 398]KAG8827193.1 glycerol ethanol, ferric requiring protein [Serendipita sp. 401]KAG8877273.1 glycerol ethanol, ferric requiring protein [Serendipita sp. 405]KAG9057568.1 glycerol ethanol, ferric requiring protein [Serendipita sp. 407]
MSHERVNISTQTHNVDEELESRKYADFTTIDWMQDATLERNRRLRSLAELQPAAARGPNGEITTQWFWRHIKKIAINSQSWFVVSLAGAIIGVNAALISITTEWLSDIKMGYCKDGWWLNQEFCCWENQKNEGAACDAWTSWSSFAVVQWFAYVLFAALFSFTAAYLVRAFARYAAGSGISEIKCILAGFVMKGYLGAWTFFIKSLTLPLVIASGLSVGKEGPSVHVACCIGYLVASFFPRFSSSQGKMREVITAASAAGVAVAFGSPIGGVVFSIEEMSHTFSIKTMWRSFFCALIATVTLSAMNPFRTGKLVLFQVTYDRDWHFFELLFFMVIGLFGGVYGAFVVKFNLQVAAFRRKFLSNHGVTEAVFLATLTAMIGYFNRFLRLDMTESLYILFRECEGGGDYEDLCQSWAQWRMANSLLLATIFRILLVIVSYGCKVPAGIFIPSMAIGATFGRMVGILVKAIYRQYPESGWFAVCDPNIPCITPGTYAFLGAAAALSGVMRITVTVVVVMFELTGALTYILPTMIVLLVTKAVGDWFGMAGIADEMIKFNGYPFLEQEDITFNIPVSRVMRRQLHTMSARGMTLQEVERKLDETSVNGYPVVAPDGHRALLGYIGRTELRYVLDRAQESQHLEPDTLCEFLSEAQSNNLEVGRSSRRAGGHSGIMAEPPSAGPDGLLPPSWSAGTGLSIEDVDNDIELSLLHEERTNARDGILRLDPWVNQTPITVGPQMPLETVVQMFKRLGPRVILVEKVGTLMGLITVKDVLRFIEKEEAESPTRQQQAAGSTSLETALEDAWIWLASRIRPFLPR